MVRHVEAAALAMPPAGRIRFSAMLSPHSVFTNSRFSVMFGLLLTSCAINRVDLCEPGMYLRQPFSSVVA